MSDTLLFSYRASGQDTVAGAANSSTATGGIFTDVHGGVVSIRRNLLALTDDGAASAFLRDDAVFAGVSGTQDQKLTIFIPPNVTYTNTTSYGVGALLRLQSGTNGDAYLMQFYVTGGSTLSANVTIYTRISGAVGFPATNVTPHNYSASFTPNPAHAYLAVFRAVGTNPTTLVAAVYDLTVGGMQQAICTDSSATLQNGNGTAGLNAASGGGLTCYYGQVQWFSGAAKLEALLDTQLGNQNTSNITLTAEPSGGSYNYANYKLYSSTSIAPNTSSGTLIYNGSSPTMTLASPTQTTYYICQVTDSAGNVAVTPQKAVLPPKQPLIVLCIGDSETQLATLDGLETPVDALGRILRNTVGPRQVTMINAGASGENAAYFAANTSGSALNNALAQVQTQLTSDPTSKVIVSYSLGTNDSQESVSSASYTASVQSTVSACTALGYTVVLNDPVSYCGLGDQTMPYATSLTYAYNLSGFAFLQQYSTALNGIANGSTVVRGSTSTIQYFINHPEEQEDQIHRNDFGNSALAAQWALPVISFVGTGGGSASGTTGTWNTIAAVASLP
jgi:hypothetical protein